MPPPMAKSFTWALVFACVFASTDAACSTIIMDADNKGTYTTTKESAYTFNDDCGILTSGCEYIGKAGFAGSGLAAMTVYYDAARVLSVDSQAFSEADDGGSLVVKMTCSGGCTTSEACTTSYSCSNDKEGGTDCVTCPCTTRRVDSRSKDWLSTKSGGGISFVTDCEQMPPSPPALPAGCAGCSIINSNPTQGDFTFADGCGVLTSGCNTIGKEAFKDSGLVSMHVLYDAASLSIEKDAFKNLPVTIKMVCNGACSAGACDIKAACEKNSGSFPATDCVTCSSCVGNTRPVDAPDKDWNKNGVLSFEADCSCSLGNPEPPPPPPSPPSPSSPSLCGDGTVDDGGGTCIIECHSGSRRLSEYCLNKPTVPPAPSTEATDAADASELISAFLAEQPDLDSAAQDYLAAYLEKFQHFQQPAPA